MELRSQIESHYIDQGLVDDLKRRLGTNNLLKWIDLEGERLANKGLIRGKYVEFTKPLLYDRKIKELRKDPRAKDACIRATGEEQFEIIYQEGLPSNRRRFSIAHEIGHTYFFRPNSGTEPLSPFQTNIGSDPTIESLCDQFAASLLLPRTSFLREFERLSANSKLDVPLHILPQLAQIFGVAERAVAIRIYFDLPFQIEAVICIRQPRRGLFNEIESEDNWQLSWLAFPKRLGKRETGPDLSIPLGKSGRNIPLSMIPVVKEQETSLIELDSRWWHGIRSLPKNISRIPFSRIDIGQKRTGLVSFCNGKFYIGLLAPQ